jgi:PhnB protein
LSENECAVVVQSAVVRPSRLGGTTSSVFLYVADVDAVVKKAVEAGLTVDAEVADQF